MRSLSRKDPNGKVAGLRGGLPARRDVSCVPSEGDRPLSAYLSRRAWLGGVAAFFFAGPAFAAGWELVGVEDGIRVSRREVPGSPIVAFRGEGMVNAPLAKVLGVLADHDHCTEWVDRLERAIVLEKKSAQDMVIYQHFSLPFPFSDRDYVYRVRGRQTASGAVSVRMKSVVHPKAPPTVGVRAEISSGRYLLTPRGPRKTHLVVEIHTDPKGALPAWLVNLVQKSWAPNTIRAIRKRVTDPSVKPFKLR